VNVLGSAVDTWATVAVAIGTLAAVAYALFRDLVVTPRRRAKLELHFDRTGHDETMLQMPDGSDALCVRMRVVNRPGKDTADDVVVIATAFRQLATDESRPIGLPLTWSGSNPPITVAAVHPGSQRHVDLLHVAGSRLQLDLTPKPVGGWDFLEPGTYEIDVEIRARNADAVGYAIGVAWDGDELEITSPERR
jgi:hypothetical protein